MYLRHQICFAVVSAVFLVAASGCSRQVVPSISANAKVQPYALRGVVLGKSALMHEVTIRQDAIHGFMPLTNAVYPIADPDLFRQLEPGDQITATVLVPSDNNQYRLEDVAIAAEPREPESAASLPAHEILMGELVPDIPLVDQDGKTIHFAQYRGKAVLITFVDTQCTDECPILTGLFSKVNALLAKDQKAYAASHLISISIDPKFDTPPVLHRYGMETLHGDAADFSHWSFVDLTPAELKRLATAFGVVYAPSSDGDIVHTLQTALIAPDGTLVETWGGDGWKPAAIAKAIEAASIAKSS
jgi:protein SCO1